MTDETEGLRGVNGVSTDRRKTSKAVADADHGVPDRALFRGITAAVISKGRERAFALRLPWTAPGVVDGSGSGHERKLLLTQNANYVYNHEIRNDTQATR